MKEIHPNVASVLTLASQYVTMLQHSPKQRKLVLEIIAKDDSHGYGKDIFNALMGKETASEDAKKTAAGLIRWAMDNRKKDR